MKTTVKFTGIKPPPIDWQSRALKAEAERDALKATIANAATVVAITKPGRMLHISFKRGNELIHLRTYAAMDLNVKALQQALLGPLI